MIAKVTVHSGNRASALRALSAALEQTEVAGTTTNLCFLQRLARHPRFVGGDVETGLIGADIDRLAAPAQTDAPRVALAAIFAVGLDQPRPYAGFGLWAPLTHEVALIVHDDPVTVRLTADDMGYGADVGGEHVRISRADITRAAALRHGDHVAGKE